MTARLLFVKDDDTVNLSSVTNQSGTAIDPVVGDEDDIITRDRFARYAVTNDTGTFPGVPTEIRVTLSAGAAVARTIVVGVIPRDFTGATAFNVTFQDAVSGFDFEGNLSAGRIVLSTNLNRLHVLGRKVADANSTRIDFAISAGSGRAIFDIVLMTLMRDWTPPHGLSTDFHLGLELGQIAQESDAGKRFVSVLQPRKSVTMTMEAMDDNNLVDPNTLNEVIRSTGVGNPMVVIPADDTIRTAAPSATILGLVERWPDIRGATNAQLWSLGPVTIVELVP